MRYTFAFIAALCLLAVLGCGGDSSDPLTNPDNTKQS